MIEASPKKWIRMKKAWDKIDKGLNGIKQEEIRRNEKWNANTNGKYTMIQN